MPKASGPMLAKCHRAPGEPAKGKGGVTGPSVSQTVPPSMSIRVGGSRARGTSGLNNYITKHITVRHITIMLLTVTRRRRGGCFCVHFTAEETEAWGLADWSRWLSEVGQSGSGVQVCRTQAEALSTRPLAVILTDAEAGQGWGCPSCSLISPGQAAL